MFHKSHGMSRVTVCWVINHINATGSIIPEEKENVAEKGFPSLGFRKRFSFPRKTSFASPQNSRFIPSEGKSFLLQFFLWGVTGPVTLNCLITQQAVALLISRDLCTIFLVMFGMFAWRMSLAHFLGVVSA